MVHRHRSVQSSRLTEEYADQLWRANAARRIDAADLLGLLWRIAPLPIGIVARGSRNPLPSGRRFDCCLYGLCVATSSNASHSGDELRLRQPSCGAAPGPLVRE